MKVNSILIALILILSLCSCSKTKNEQQILNNVENKNLNNESEKVLVENKKIDKNLTNFFDINWGTTPDNVKTIMINKGFTLWSNTKMKHGFPLEVDGDQTIFWVDDIFSFRFYKGQFAGEDAEIDVTFFKNKFYEGIVRIKYDNKNINIADKYFEFINLFQEKYGKFTQETIEDVTFVKTWDFIDGNSITLVASLDSQIIIINYENNGEVKKEIEVEKEKEKERAILEYRKNKAIEKEKKLGDI